MSAFQLACPNQQICQFCVSKCKTHCQEALVRIHEPQFVSVLKYGADESQVPSFLLFYEKINHFAVISGFLGTSSGISKQEKGNKIYIFNKDEQPDFTWGMDKNKQIGFLKKLKNKIL